jgi:hypothetical protein
MLSHRGMALVEVNAVSKCSPRRAGSARENKPWWTTFHSPSKRAKRWGRWPGRVLARRHVARMILGLAKPSAGLIIVDGVDVAQASSTAMPLVLHLCTRIAVMVRGRLVVCGETEAVCAHPREAYTQQLIAATPELLAGAKG